MDENRHKRTVQNYHLPFVYGLLRMSRYNGGTRKPYRSRLGFEKQYRNVAFKSKMAQPPYGVNGGCAYI